MAAGRFHFGEFSLDPAERRLMRGTTPLDLSGRYLDALTLLLRERGRLVTKERLLDDVWRGVPVTDEALTQCVRALRRQLGDDAARPRFIETVPKHGYRFVGEARWVDDSATATLGPSGRTALVRVSSYCAVGGAAAGVGGGLFYGLAAMPPPGGAGLGQTAMLLVMLLLNVVVGFVGGLGVGAGISASARVGLDRWQSSTGGGMIGGLLIGGAVKLIGLDAFSLLFGRSPQAMAGPAEGALLGAALGLAAWSARDRALSVRNSAAVGGLGGAVAGFLTPLLGGHLLGGSLNLLTREFPGARFRLDSIGLLLGEQGFGRLSELVTSTLEGCLFGVGVVGALAVAARPWGALHHDRDRPVQTTRPI